MANLDLIRGRQVVAPLTNRTGGDVIAGDVVVVDTANDESFIATTTLGATGSVGIVQEAIVSLGVGRVLLSGYAPLVNVTAAVTRGHYAKTDTTAKKATGTAAREAGSFGQYITGGTLPKAIIWGAGVTAAVAGTSTLTVEEADGAPTDSAITKLVFPNGSLAIGGHVATYTPPGGGGGSVAVSSADSTGDVTLGTGGTYVDIISLTLAAGSYLLIAEVQIRPPGGGGTAGLRLWDGTTIYRAGTAACGNTNYHLVATLVAFVTLSASTTVKVSGTADTGGVVAATTAPSPNTGGTNRATTLQALKVA